VNPVSPAVIKDPVQIAAAEAKIRALRSQITDQVAQLQSAQDPVVRQQAMARLNEMQASANNLQRNLGPASLVGNRVSRINVAGVSDQVRDDLISRLPVHVGDTMAADSLERITKTVQEFDEHMVVSHGKSTNGDVAITIFAPAGGSGSSGVLGGIIGAVPMAASAPPPPGTKRITIGGNVQQAKLITQTRPAYPPLAKQARISGVVHLQAIIAKDGTVADLKVISGHPLLIPAALEAVKTWVYATTLLNGEPVEVQTQIDVNFTLSDELPPPGGGN
jgi:TonB family protein